MWKTTTTFDFTRTGPTSRSMPTVLEGSETDAKWLLFRNFRIDLQAEDGAGNESSSCGWDNYAEIADEKIVERLWNTESAAQRFADYNASLNISGITTTFDGEVPAEEPIP